MSEKLTPEQIKNWRQVMAVTLGPYALIMPESEIQAIKDRLQAQAAEHRVQATSATGS